MTHLAQVGLLLSAALALAAAWGDVSPGMATTHMAGFYWLIGILFYCLAKGPGE